MYKKYLKLILKSLILAGLISLEKVIGLPIISLFLALFWANKLLYSDKLVFSLMVSIILATIYQLDFAASFGLLGVLYFIFVVLQDKVKNYSWRLLLSAWAVSLLLLVPYDFSSFLGLALQVLLSIGLAVWGKRLPFLYQAGGFRSGELGY
jgi:hypothetical protein